MEKIYPIILGLIAAMFSGSLITSAYNRWQDKRNKRELEDSKVKEAEILDRQQFSTFLAERYQESIDAREKYIREIISLSSNIADLMAKQRDKDTVIAEKNTLIQELNEEILAINREMDGVRTELMVANNSWKEWKDRYEKMKTEYPYNNT
jgi:chromosome segregation ATPase